LPGSSRGGCVGEAAGRATRPSTRRAIQYVLRYTLAGIIERTLRGGYRLDHDFAFGDRPGEIRRFTLDLQLDPAWRAQGRGASRGRGRAAAPGGWLARRAAARARGTEVAARGGLAPVRSSRRHSRRPRWSCPSSWSSGWSPASARRAASPPRPRRPFSRADLERDIFTHPPEVIGAAWDGSVGEPEVGAVVARLVQEGKLRSEVRPSGILSLELLVGRETFEGYDQGAGCTGSSSTAPPPTLRRSGPTTARGRWVQPRCRDTAGVTRRVEDLVGADPSKTPWWGACS
jgi:hypothetical protein